MSEFYHQSDPEQQMEGSFGSVPPVEQNLSVFERAYGDPTQSTGPRLEKQLSAIEAQTESSETLRLISEDIEEIKKTNLEMLKLMKTQYQQKDEIKLANARATIDQTPFEYIEDLREAA